MNQNLTNKQNLSDKSVTAAQPQLLSQYIETQYKNDIAEFASDNEFRVEQVKRWLSRDAAISEGYLCLRNRNTEEYARTLHQLKKVEGKTRFVAISLRAYLDKNHNGSALDMAKSTGIRTTQIQRWLDNNAIVANNRVFLKASKFDESPDQSRSREEALSKGVHTIDFNRYLSDKFDGHQSNFAAEFNILQQQVCRWTKQTCLFVKGQVYRMQRNLLDPNDKKGIPVLH
jgi:hypothetical protein